MRLSTSQQRQPHPNWVNPAITHGTQSIPQIHHFGEKKEPVEEETPWDQIFDEISQDLRPIIYLLKSASTNEYLQENLQMLAAPNEAQFYINYAVRWIEPGLREKIKAGDEACIFLGDRPYRHFVPVRQARVVEAIEQQGEWTITVELGSFVDVQDWEFFSQRFTKLNQSQYFVVRDPIGQLDFVPEGQVEDAWRRVIDALHRSSSEKFPSRYKDTVFLRPLGVFETPGGRERDRLEAGKEYELRLDCYAPQFTPEQIAKRSLIVEPSAGNVIVGDNLTLPRDDRISVKVLPLDPGDVALRLWVKPNRAQSTTLLRNYQVVEPSSTIAEQLPPEKAAPAKELGNRHLRAIFEALEKPDGLARHQATLSLVETLASLVPDSHYLEEQRGLALWRLQEWDKAYEQFSQLDPDLLSPQAVTAWFVSACRAGIEADVDQILSYFTAWEHRPLVDQLIEALPNVEESRRLAILEDAWLGSGRYSEMWEVVKETFLDPQNALRAAKLMVDPQLYDLLTPRQGYRYLRQVGSPWTEAPIELLERAVAWGFEEPDAAPDLDEAFLILLDRTLQRRSDPSQAWELVTQAREHLPAHTWAEATAQLADALARESEAEWRDNACRLYVDLARVHREQLGDLDIASDYLRHAKLLASEGSDLVEVVEKEESRWEAAVTRIASIQRWREGFQAVRLQHLRERLSGKRAVFVGGRNKGFDAEETRKELGLEKADFAPHFRSERGDLDQIRDKIKAGKTDYVIDFIRFGPHRDLEDDCRQAGVTYVRVLKSRSLHQIVRALARVYSIELDD